MEDIKDDAIHQTAMKLAEEIKNLSIHKSFYSDVQVSYIWLITWVASYYIAAALSIIKFH